MRTLLHRLELAGFARAMLAIATAWPLVTCATLSGEGRSVASLSEYREYMAERTTAELAESEDKPRTVDEKIAAARRFHRVGQVNQAMRQYFAAYRHDPEDLRAEEGIAYLQLSEQPELAERVLLKVAAEEPLSPMTQIGLGLARYAQGDPEGATAPLERAIELSPDSAAAHNSLSVVLARLGRYDAALRHAGIARSLAPEDAEIANNLGFSHLIAGNVDSAEEAIRDAIALGDGKAAYRNNLGLALGGQGRYHEALREFQSAGTEQAAHNNIAYLYFVQGRLDEAIGHYERALLAHGDATSVVLRNLNVALDARATREGTNR